MSSNYVRNQNSVQRWDNVLNNLRRDVAILKRLTLRKIRGNLVTSSKGIVRSGNNLFGQIYIGKIILDDNIYIDPEDSGKFDVDDFETTFEYPQIDALLTNDHLFTVPDQVNDLSLIGKNVYLKININFLAQIIEERDENPTFSITVERNRNEDIEGTDEGVIIYGSDEIYNSGEYIIAKYFNLQLVNIIKCQSGDTIDLVYETSDYIKCYIGSGNFSYISFEIIGCE